MFDFLKKKKSIIDAGLLQGGVDNHSHILFGVDDGVRTLEESLDILAYLERQGLKKLWLTPHTMEDVPNTTQELKDRFQLLKESYSGPIELALASEYMIDTVFESRLSEGDLLLHGDDLVLVETSTWNPPINLWEVLEKMMKKGYRPLLAHPERYRYMKNSDYDRLHQMGVVFQLNLPSIVGFYGEDITQRAEYLLDKDWYTMVGSDCHRMKRLENQFNNKALKKDTIEAIKPLCLKDTL